MFNFNDMCVCVRVSKYACNRVAIVVNYDDHKYKLLRLMANGKWNMVQRIGGRRRTAINDIFMFRIDSKLLF